MDDLKIPISLTEYNNMSQKHIAILCDLQEKRIEARNKALEREQKEQELRRNKGKKTSQKVPIASMKNFPQWGG